MLGVTTTLLLEIVTVAVASGLVPPVPVQVSVYDLLAVSAPVLCVPLVPS
jgi:hypothetical protein